MSGRYRKPIVIINIRFNFFLFNWSLVASAPSVMYDLLLFPGCSAIQEAVTHGLFSACSVLQEAVTHGLFSACSAIHEAVTHGV